uniref:LY6/PLAUR domain containing 1 n=1 Tax=Laticauda laticaudata TaxID=8630 RepID=A0A8C5RTN6_LATLA
MKEEILRLYDSWVQNISSSLCVCFYNCVTFEANLSLITLITAYPFLFCVAGILYRKSCASSAACLMTSAGYQTFCTPGKINSVCISCCNTPLCNGPRPKKRGNAGIMPRAGVLTTMLLSSLPFLSPALC